jgi:hypothetical protein
VSSVTFCLLLVLLPCCSLRLTAPLVSLVSSVTAWLSGPGTLSDLLSKESLRDMGLLEQ